MSRYHYWQFIVNQEGQPINNAEVSLYLAGTNTPAFVYSSEFGPEGTETTPQAITNKAGYFEFWLGDDQEEKGYPIGQKFKLQWERENVASGSIDWVDIYPGFEPVDESNSESNIKNKMVSNNLAYNWNNHSSHNVTVDGFPVHGINKVEPEKSDNLINKLVNNKMIHDLLNHINGSNDHSELNIITDGILTGGGPLTDDITISLDAVSIDHNSMTLQGGQSPNEYYHLTNDQHANLTVGSPTFTNLTLTGEAFAPNHAVKKDYVDNIAQGIYWQNSVLDFWDAEDLGFPDNPHDSDLIPDLENGDRYIASTTYSDGPNSWTENYIYEWDDVQRWIEIEPQRGFTLLVEEENRHYHFDGSKWIKFFAGFAWYLEDDDFLASNRCGYLVDCRLDTVIVTLPSSPTMGYRIDILDFTSSSATNNIIVDGDGELVQGQPTFSIDVDGAGIQLVYTTPEFGWKVINEVYT